MTNTKQLQINLPFGLFVALILFATPLFSSAYFTTAQGETDLGNGTGLFMIEYRFGVQKHDIHIPVKAGLTSKQENDTVSYKILDRTDTEVSGSMFGIVLSDAAINEKGMYVIPKGTTETFKLAVLFTPEDSEVDKYRLQVAHLPFQFDGEQQLQLNPSELIYYKTKQLKL